MIVARDTLVPGYGTFSGEHGPAVRRLQEVCGVYIGVGAVTLILVIVLLILLF
ncbi:MAG: hypothetical protein M3Q03_05425 [Chloroflexota bacterium]|nr:hypothetical protein [Chloroflexota bacterium]